MSFTWTDKAELTFLRLKDWLNRTSGETPNLHVDLVNRATDWLWSKYLWEFLVKDASLTLDANREASLPADFGKVVKVFNGNGTGIEDYRYFANHEDYARRYDLVTAFDKATGHAWKLRFASAHGSSIYCRYQQGWTQYSSEDASSYLLFPAELTLRTAQKLRMEDKGATGPEWEIINSAAREALDTFVTAHQYIDRDPRLPTVDANFRIVKLDMVDMDGQIDYGYQNNDRSVDGRY